MGSDPTPARILIAEDEFPVAAQLKEQVESLGHAVAGVVGSGEEAVEAALRERPDLVLMDIILSGRMDGVEAAERIREALGVPIIFLSALADQAGLRRASLAQPYGYLLKPFDERQLRVALEMGLYVSAADRRRHRAEAALKESEEKFRLLFDQAPMPYQSLDESGRFLAVNDAWLEALGYAREEVLGRSFADFLHPDWVAHFQANFPRFKALGEVLGVEFEMVKKDGSLILVAFNGRVGRDERGEFLRTHCVFQDITARRQAERSLQESEEKYRLLTETLEEIVCLRDLEGRIAYINQAGAGMLGYGPGELAGRDLFDLLAPEALPEAQRRRTRRRSGHLGKLRYETVFQTRDGRRLPVEVQSIPLHREDYVTGFVILARDMTERQQAEREVREARDKLAGSLEALGESEERFRLLAETTSDAILLRDAAGLIEYANPAAVRLLRAQGPEELAGRLYLDLVHPDDQAGSRERIRLSLEQDGVAPLREHRLLALDGQVVEVESIGAPFTFRGKRYIQGVFRDITARKEAEAEKKRLEAQLRQSQKMQAIGTLAGGIAHDFNNILAVIIGHAELGLLDLPERHPGRLSFDNILKAGLRAKGMIRQILDFSRPAEENRHPLQVESIIKEAMKLLRPSLPTTIEIRVNVAATGPVLADPSQIHQMLMNLCANAAYAMREKGGVLEVGLQETALDDRTATRYAELKPGRYVRLSVSDTGQGMDHQTLERIFEPFFTTKRPGEGTGMGLAVVHNIVRSHHGQINVYSEPGQGAVFNVYLPLLERPEAEAGGPETGAIPQGRERILFVDDEEMLVGLGQALLSRLGYQVTALTSSLKALEIFRSDPQAFDLLLTDQTMPHLTGLQLAQQVLRLRPDLPVILCSGFSETVNAESALAAGVKAFAMKPLSLRDIAATIRQALGPAPPPPQAKAGEA